MATLVVTGDVEDKFNVPSDDWGSHPDDTSFSGGVFASIIYKY